MTEETLKVIIAVIGLVLLAYFLISFFSSGSKQQKQREAVESIERISQIVSNLETSGGNVTALQPQRWTLFSFTGGEKKPNQCSGENCICICNKVLVDVLDRQINKCSKEGSCLVIPNLRGFQDIKIQPYKKEILEISIQKIGGEVQIRRT